MTPQEAWRAAYDHYRAHFNPSAFNAWLRDLHLLRYDEARAVFVIGTKDAAVRSMCMHNLYRVLRRAVVDAFGRAVELEFEVMAASDIPTPVGAPAPFEEMPLFKLLAEQPPALPTGVDEPLHTLVARPQSPIPTSGELNNRYTFDRFITHRANALVYEAAQAVVEMPASAYNPLFVYGAVGLGKTHLLQAIAHACRARGRRVLYVPAEAFTHDLIEAIRRKQQAMLREKYRGVDVLLMDDVQFMSDKDSTQEEFFHTFDALYRFNKQIVVAADRPPAELTRIVDRLRSRFASGLIADVQPPEYEARVAILRLWASESGLHLPDDVAHVLANSGANNVRELEGMFTRMKAQAQLNGGRLTTGGARNTAQQHSQPRQHSKQRGLTIERVLSVTASAFELDVDDLVGKSRTRQMNTARQVAMLLARELTEASLPQIGGVFDRTHSTVLHSLQKAQEDIAANADLRAKVQHIRTKLCR